MAAVIACAALAAPAAAQPGKLYEPFSKPADSEQIRDFVEKLPGGGRDLAGALSDEDLEQGRAVRRPAAAPLPPAPDRGSASARAGEDTGLAPSMGWALALALLVLTVGSARVISSRQA
jgi:hypothetical protein